VIEQLLELARRQGQAADALWRRGEHTSVALEWGRLKAAGISEESGVGLRLVRDGRVGIAGSTAVSHLDLDALVARARASAELGEQLGLQFPGRTPLPAVLTFDEPAAEASLDQLIQLGRTLGERLARPGCQVNVTVERAVLETRIANTAGADDGYRATAVAVSADVWRVAGDDVLAIGDAYDGIGLPSAQALTDLADSLTIRLERALQVVPSPEGALPVIFTPAGLAAVMLPITQALSGKALLQGISPLAGKVGEQVFGTGFSLTDDPLAPERPASRPCDDEGVPSHTLPLVERGVVREFIYDLETAARAKTASTGHAQRGIFGKPVPGYTSLVLGPGPGGAAPPERGLGGGLAADLRDGLLVDELIGVGQGNVMGGSFSHPVALAYRVQRGEITGRVKHAAIAGNVYELLNRIGGWGTDARWTGARWGPSVLLEGVSVAGR